MTALTVTNGVFNIVSGTVKDEDDMSSDSATVVATQQSIKDFFTNLIAQQDLDIALDGGTAQSIVLFSEAMTFLVVQI